MEATKGTVGERTWIGAEVDVRVHIGPALGKVRLDGLSALRLQSFYGAKLDSGLSPRTVRIIHATLYKALKQAVRWQLIPRNVAESVDPPKADGKEIETLDEGQARGSSRPPRGTSWRPCTSWPSPRACAPANSSGSSGRTWTSGPGPSG